MGSGARALFPLWEASSSRLRALSRILGPLPESSPKPGRWSRGKPNAGLARHSLDVSEKALLLTWVWFFESDRSSASCVLAALR